MVKSGLEGKKFAQNCKAGKKNDHLCAWRDFDKCFCDVYKYNK